MHFGYPGTVAAFPRIVANLRDCQGIQIGNHTHMTLHFGEPRQPQPTLDLVRPFRRGAREGVTPGWPCIFS